MNSMNRYYISRALISGGLVVLLSLAGLQVWIAAIVGFIVLAFFLWAPLSGRYTVNSKNGALALGLDERTQMIKDQAARNAFVATILMVAGLALYFGAIAPGNVPVDYLYLILVISTLVYNGSDLWLRRT